MINDGHTDRERVSTYANNRSRPARNYHYIVRIARVHAEKSTENVGKVACVRQKRDRPVVGRRDPSREGRKRNA